MENTNAVPSDVTLDNKNCKASIGSKGTNISEESTKFSINLSITYNGKSTTQQNIPWKQDDNNVVSTAFVSWAEGYTGTEYNIEVKPDSTSYAINKKVNVINTYTFGATKESIDIGTVNKDTNVDVWNLDAASGKVTYPANTTIDVITVIDAILLYNSNSIKLKFIQLGIEPAINITPAGLTFESGSTTPQNVTVDSTDSWTAK